MQITYNRSDDSDADFNTTRVGVSGTLNCRNLNAWGSKSRVVPTSFGALKMAAFETPLPTFADWGKGQCGPEGWCLIALDPRYAETIAQHGQLTWLLTDCDGTGHLWAEDCGQYTFYSTFSTLLSKPHSPLPKLPLTKPSPLTRPTPWCKQATAQG